jgi:hypothetical protein
MLSKHSEEEEEEEIVNVLAIVVPFLCFPDPIPKHDSVRTGAMYYKEFMETENSPRFFENFRMDREISFIPLVELLQARGELEDGLEICAGQKVMIFIYILSGLTNSKVAEAFQHSGSTISVVFHEVMESLLRVQHLLFEMPKANDAVSLRNKLLFAFINS